MPKEVTVTEEETTQEQTEDNQTVTIEQFEEMQSMNSKLMETVEGLKKSQSGSDSKVTELQNQLKRKDDNSKSDEQKNTDAIAELKNEILKERTEKLHERYKGIVTQLLIDADLSVPRGIDRLIGTTEEETLNFVKDYIDDRNDEHAKAKDREAKKNGRRVVDTTQKSQEKMSYEDMQGLSDEQFNAIPKELVNKAMDAALGAN